MLLKHPFTLAFVLSAIVVIVPFTTTVHGQSTTSGPKASNKGKEISVTESFEPTFRIEPLSHHLTAKNGAIVSFEFSVESANRDADIEVSPIGLRQEISGMILHDQVAPQADMIKLTSPSKVKLAPNTPVKIQGLVQFPRGEAKFHSIGILVKDVGTAAKLAANADPNKQKTQAAIRFITQYVLRIDLEVEGVRGENANVLTVEKLDMVPVDGRPKLMAQILNPSDSTFEFEVRAKLRSSPSDRTARSIRLAMPVRESMETDERFVGRILPKSRIRMVELLPEAIASGIYDADIEILLGDKVLAKKTHKVEVNASDFPAQEVLIAQLGQDVQVSPAQIELSQLRGGNRRMTLLVKNNGKDAKTIDLSALDASGLALNAATVQPQNFTIAPNGNRKIAITLKSQSNAEEPVLYGLLHVQCRSDRKDYDETRNLPLALALKKAPLAEVKMSPVQWDATGKYTCFRNTVTNQGSTHLALEARLSIFDERGARVQIPAGFGKWLMPGESAKLEFRMQQPLAPGKYQMKCELQHGDRPVLVEQVFEVTDLAMAGSSKPVSIESPKLKKIE